MFGHNSLIFITALLATVTMQVCGQVDEPLIDLDPLDNTTINTTAEYFDMDRVIFLANMTNFITPNGDWSSIFLVITRGERSIDEMVDIYPDEAHDAGRVDDDYRGLFRRTRVFMTQLAGFDIDSSLVIDGMQLEVNSAHPASNGSVVMDSNIIEIALNSSGYIVREHPGYGPRIVCIIADDLVTNTTACLTFYFIGYNDDPPVVTYEPTSNATFTEGQMEYIPIIAGDLNVIDPDHPERYLMMSAQAQIEGYRTGYPEFLSVTYVHPDFGYNYNMATGVLTISGNAPTDMYTQLLSNLTYFNNMTEPLGDSRSIIITVFDGKFTSDPISVLVIINNTNDAPVISLNGEEDPVSRQFSTNYTEATLAQRIVPDVLVVDTDPNALIRRVTVTLTNPIDGTNEEISISEPALGLTITPNSPSHLIDISGIAAKSEYTDVLRSLTYQHLDANPGNPSTTEPRILVFYVEDDQATANVVNSTLELTILPVNDAPILFFVSDPVVRENPSPVLSGVTQMSFTYIEDDPPLNFGRDIYLRDVDGNISSTILNLTNLLNGEQDRVYADPMLLNENGIIMETVSESEENRVIILNATGYEGVTPMAFEEVLRSLSYTNRYPDNRVTDGVRMLSIMTTDTSGDESGSIIVDITVVDRNDGPVVNVGGGRSMDFMITFVENGPSIPIALSHLIDIMDEEMHDISSLSVELIATNGDLDPNDAIFLRSPMSLPFLDNFATPPTNTFINIALNATVDVYEQALRAIYYDNSEIEPTIYNATGMNLTRVVVIRITDTNFADPGVDANDVNNADLGTTTTEIRIGINIEPINDNPPRILLLAEPQGCATGSVNVSDAQANIRRRRRDIRTAASIRKRSVQGLNNVMAPQVTSAHVRFTKVSDSVSCVHKITIGFNVNTSIPIVEVPAKLDHLISFDVQELNSAKKIGRWMDHRTMTVFFEDCVNWENRTTSGKERPIHIMFDTTGDECDWSTLCTSGVCFANDTGCPVTGAYLLKYNQSDPGNEAGPGSDSSVYNEHHHYIVTLLISVGIIIALTVGCVIALRYRKVAAKPHKVITLEDVNISTAVTLPPLIHKQQPEDKPILSHVQDLPPPTSPLSSSPVATDHGHKTVKNTSRECPHLKLPKTPDSSVPSWSVVSTMSVSSTCDLQGVQDVDDNSPSSDAGRNADARCTDTTVTSVNRAKQQSPGKRRKKRSRAKSPKTVTDKLELKRPVTEDNCKWLQLEASENRELNEKQQNVSKSCGWSHDLPCNSDLQDTEQLIHHQTTLTISTEENRSSTQGISLQAPSPIIQQQRLSETPSSVQSMTCKH